MNKIYEETKKGCVMELWHILFLLFFYEAVQ